MSSLPTRVLVILGSVRAGRVCPQVADWFVSVARSVLPAIDFEVVDLQKFPLPMDVEPHIPRQSADYVNDNTRAWSAKVSSASGYVIVTPQYNWGYPAVLKNALDILYKEWNGKPVVLVNYGGHGGGQCGAQLRPVLNALQLKCVNTKVELKLRHELMNGQKFDAHKEWAADVDAATAALKELQTILSDNATKAEQLNK